MNTEPKPAASSTASRLLPWLWVPTLYLFEGIPNSIVEKIGPILLQDLKVGKESIPSLVALAALPWALKPLWSPLIDLYKTKRFWIWSLQTLTSLCLFLAAALVLHGAAPTSLIPVLLLIAFFSATHDIAADGFYLHGLSPDRQSYFIGIRNTCYRFGPIFCQGILVGAVGLLVKHSSLSIETSWTLVLVAAAIPLLGLAFYHKKILPRPASDQPISTPPQKLLHEFATIWIAFFKLKGILELIAFFFFFRLAEVQLTRIATIFLKDSHDQGGLALDNDTVGLVYGTFGVGALIVGGILGGMLVFRYGLRRLIWPMVLIMHIPNIAFIGLAHWQPESIGWIAAGIIVEQFGYGIGYTAFSIVMLRIADGPHRAAHFAFAAGLAYLGTLIPALWIGHLQAKLGYENFFWWVMLCTIPGFIVTWLVMKNQPHPAKASS